MEEDVKKHAELIYAHIIAAHLSSGDFIKPQRAYDEAVNYAKVFAENSSKDVI